MDNIIKHLVILDFFFNDFKNYVVQNVGVTECVHKKKVYYTVHGPSPSHDTSKTSGLQPIRKWGEGGCCVGEKEILACNVTETRYRSGLDMPEDDH